MTITVPSIRIPCQGIDSAVGRIHLRPPSRAGRLSQAGLHARLLCQRVLLVMNRVWELFDPISREPATSLQEDGEEEEENNTGTLTNE